jgi:hypothetical protein
MRALGLLAGLVSASLLAQSTPMQLEPILAKPIQAPGVVEHQLKTYLTTRVPELRSPRTASEWAVQAEAIRKHVLDERRGRRDRKRARIPHAEDSV